MPGSPPNYTVGQIFDKLGKLQWWLPQYVGERFGESYNGFPEYGTDFGIPYGTSVGSISDGTVVYSGYQGSQGCQSLGYVVQVSSSDGLYHYQHLQSSSVSVNDAIFVGGEVGKSGGLPADNCSSGAHIEVRWSPKGAPNHNYPWFNNNTSIWVDPLNHYRQLAGLPSIPSLSGVLGGITGSQTGSELPYPALAQRLLPNADVGELLKTIDALFVVVNPFDFTYGQYPDAENAPFGIGAILHVFETITYDLVPLILHAIFLILGVIILWKLLNTFIDVQGTINKGAGLAIKGAMLA